MSVKETPTTRATLLVRQILWEDRRKQVIDATRECTVRWFILPQHQTTIHMIVIHSVATRDTKDHTHNIVVIVATEGIMHH
jgi:hypothetical protein